VIPYMDAVNHPLFREASLLQHQMFQKLVAMGMTDEEAKGWISSWNSQNTTGEP